MLNVMSSGELPHRIKSDCLVTNRQGLGSCMRLSETNTQTQIHVLVIIRISTWIYDEAVYSQLKNVEIMTVRKVRLIEVDIVFKCYL